MSAKATFWAWEQKLSSSEKLVLLCLADCHNGDNGRCDPSAKYIAEQTGLNIKTIPSALKSLLRSELITIKNRPGKSPQFLLNLTQNWVTPKTGVHQKRVTPKTDITSPDIGETPTPKTGDEPKRNLNKNLKDNIYKKISLANLPDFVSHETAKEFIDHRVNLKKPLTQNAFDRAMRDSIKLASLFTLSPDQIITEIIDAGWQWAKVDWLENRLKTQRSKASAFDRAGDRSWAQGVVSEQ